MHIIYDYIIIGKYFEMSYLGMEWFAKMSNIGDKIQIKRTG